MNKNILVRGGLAGVFLGIAFLSGCGKSAASGAAANSQLFPSAPLKDDWDTVTAAIKTNGFFVATTTLNKMRQENPTPDQLAAINGTMRAVSQQMTDLAAKGDANARNAVEQLRASEAPKR